MGALKVVSIGNSLGVILTKDLLQNLHVKKGDKLYASKTPEGISLTPYNEEVAHQIELAKEIMRDNRDVLKELAK